MPSLIRKPKNAVRPHVFAGGVTAFMHDHLTDNELAYIAGIVDGEGTIWSSHPKSNRTPLVLSVTMIHRPTIAWLHSVAGGQIETHRTKQVNARQGWRWKLKSARTYSLLLRIRPFMRTKAEEADVALALGETLWADNVRGRVTDDVLARRRSLGQVLRDLKRREWPE